MMTENTLAVEAAQAAEDVAPETAAQEQPKQAEAEAPEPTDAADPAGEKDDGDERRRNRRTAQERISQLTRQKRELEEEVTRLREQAAKPPKQEDFGDDYDAYERAKAKHAAREAMADDYAERAKAQQERISAAMQADWREAVDAFKANAPDFDDVVYSPRVPITESMAETIMLLGDDGPRVAYHLARNPAEAARLANLPERAAALEMGRMADRLKAPPRRTVSSAPPPVAPVVGGGGSTEKDPSKMSYAEYRKWRTGK